MLVHPIQFAFPLAKLPKGKVEKSMFFSDLSPLGRAKKYKFYIENDYYQHYGKSHFALTMKKGGWDCLRHYEILASGSLPYFLGIENCPKNSLFAWPRDLLAEIKNLPGMPDEKSILRALKKNNLDQLKPTQQFDNQKYWDLHQRWSIYFQEHLTSRALADYFLKSLGLKTNGQSKILLCFGIAGSVLDYMRDVLISSLASDERISLVVYPNPYWQLKSCHRSILNTLYGRGFTCTGTLDPSMYEAPSTWDNISARIEHFDAIVACSSSNHGFSTLPPEVQTTLEKRSDVIWVDGNDINADHSIPSCAKMVFRREDIEGGIK